MGWLKRNLFFAIGVAVAVVLLALAALYVVTSVAANQKNFDKLNELYSTLGGVKPGSDNQDNIDAARRQADELRQWVRKTRDRFQPIAPIPSTANGLTDDAFASALHRTITQMTREADTANVVLPPQYNFSFQAQSDKVRFAPPGSAEKLAAQLGEVKAIADVLFAARVNGLDAIQRMKVSDDDAAGGADYIEDQPVTTDLATLTPYQVTFRGFTDQIASVLAGFANSSHGFIIKSVSVQPSDLAATSTDAAAPAPAPTGRNPQTVLDERMLRVTIMVEVVKLNGGR